MTVEPVGAASVGGTQPSIVDSRHSWYVLALLTLSYALAYVDRQMLNLLVDPIKHDLGISDTQFSLVQGTAFVMAYLAGAPIFGRLVDISNRRNLLIAGVCIWSLCTALCGLAGSYQQLFMARCGVGLAEACIFPVSISLIGDYFSPQRAPRALSIFSLGNQLGGGFSLVASGLVIAFAADLRDHIGLFRSLANWQMAFIVIGLPSILFAFVLLTLREPRGAKRLAPTTGRKLAMSEVRELLWQRRRFYLRIYLAIGMIGIVLLGIPSWFPAYMIRVHDIPASRTGYLLGVMAITAGTLGTLSGPFFAQWLERRGYPDALLRAAAISSVGMFLSCAAMPVTGSAAGALVAVGGAIFFCGFPTGIVAAATQYATPPRMRGVVASIYTFTAQIIGYMLGPTIVALLTDRVFKDPKMVGYSLQIVTCTASVLAFVLLVSSLRHYRRIIDDLEHTA